MVSHFSKHGIARQDILHGRESKDLEEYLDLLQTLSKNLLFMVAEGVDEVVGERGHRAEWGNLKLDVLPSNGKVGKLSHDAAVVHDCRDVTVEPGLFAEW